MVPKRGKCEISRLCRLLCGRAQPFRPTAKKRKTIKFLGSVSSRKAGGFPHSPCRPVADPVVTRKFHVASRRINNLRELSGEQGAEPHWPVASGCFTSAEAFRTVGNGLRLIRSMKLGAHPLPHWERGSFSATCQSKGERRVIDHKIGMSTPLMSDQIFNSSTRFRGVNQPRVMGCTHITYAYSAGVLTRSVSSGRASDKRSGAV